MAGLNKTGVREPVKSETTSPPAVPVGEDSIATRTTDPSRRRNTPHPVADVDTEKNFLLLIAIDYYADSDLNLTNPVRDANALLEVLLNRYTYAPKNPDAFVTLKQKEEELNKIGGRTPVMRYADSALDYKVFADDRIVCLYNEEATVSNISRKLHALAEKMKKDDRLLIYYAGHGDTIAGMGNMFVMTARNFDKTDSTTYFKPEDLTGKLSKNVCRNILLVIDACFSGAAQFGNKHETDEPFSRELLMSASHVQEALDGKEKQGSPFSLAMVEFLNDNTEFNQFSAGRLVEKTKPLLQVRLAGYKQDIIFEKAPGFENGYETFLFELRNKDIPPIEGFANGFIQFLNFNIIRNTIREEIDSSINQDYMIVCAVGDDKPIHGLQGRVTAKELLQKRKSGKLSRPAIHIEYHLFDSIWESIVQRLDLTPGTEPFEAHCISHFGRELISTTDNPNPLCLHFSFNTLLSEQVTEFCRFCHAFIDGLHVYKQEYIRQFKKQYPEDKIEFDPLYIFLHDIRNESKNFFDDEPVRNSITSPLRQSRDLEPCILAFPMEREISLGTAEFWRDTVKFEAGRFQQFKESDWWKTAFSNRKKMKIDDFILTVSEEVGLDRSQVADLLFFYK